jgi:hypothetical protein
MPDLQTQLRQYALELDQRYPDIEFSELAERITPSRRRRSTALRGPAVALVAAVVVLAVIGGVALLYPFGPEAPVATRPTQPTTTSPVTVTAPAQSTAASVPPAATLLPPGFEPLEPTQVEHIDTSLGRWTWQRFDGLVSELEPITPEPSYTWGGAAAPPGTPTPVTEGVNWEEGTDVFAATLDGVTVMVASHFGRVDWTGVLSINPIWDITTRTLRDSSRSLSMDVVRGAPDSVEFRDIDTGEVVLTLEATDPTIVAEQLTGEASRGPYWGPVTWSLGVDDGDMSWIEPPWQGLAVDHVRLARTSDNLILVAVGRPAWEDPNRSSILWSWRSDDGRTWHAMGDPVRIDEVATELEVATTGDQVVAVLAGYGASPVALVGGSRWQPAEAIVDAGGFLPYGFGATTWGWMLAGYRQEQAGTNWNELCDVWLSIDALTWERLAISPDVSAMDDVMGTGCYLSGDTVIAIQDTETDAVRWVGGLGG